MNLYIIGVVLNYIIICELGKLDNVLETVETVSEVMEDLAEETEKLAEEVDKRLPQDAKLKEAAQLVEKLAVAVDKEARLTQQLIHKVIIFLFLFSFTLLSLYLILTFKTTSLFYVHDMRVTRAYTLFLKKEMNKLISCV